MRRRPQYFALRHSVKLFFNFFNFLNILLSGGLPLATLARGHVLGSIRIAVHGGIAAIRVRVTVWWHWRPIQVSVHVRLVRARQRWMVTVKVSCQMENAMKNLTT